MDVDKLKHWGIYVEDASWPVVPDRRFIVAAAIDLLWTRFGLRARDVALDDDTEGYRNVVANDLADLLMGGSLVAHAQPFGDQRVSLVPAAEWTPASAFDAVRGGFMHRRHGSRKAHPHWILIGLREAQLMQRVYGATDMLQPPEDRGPAEDLGDVILGSLSAIARNPAAIEPEHSAHGVVRLLLPDSEWSLHANDRGKLVTAAVPWLLVQFAADIGNGKDRQDFEEEAIAAFAPFMTKRLFDQVWSSARARIVPRKGAGATVASGPSAAAGSPHAATRADPALKVHQHYFRPGRRSRITPPPAIAAAGP